MADVDGEIRIIARTGKVIMGSRRSLRELKLGRVKLVIVASNCPRRIVEDVKHYAKLSKTPVYFYPKSNVELGIACGKPFTVSVLAVKDFGDSNIMRTLGYEKAES